MAIFYLSGILWPYCRPGSRIRRKIYVTPRFLLAGFMEAFGGDFKIPGFSTRGFAIFRTTSIKQAAMKIGLPPLFLAFTLFSFFTGCSPGAFHNGEVVGRVTGFDQANSTIQVTPQRGGEAVSYGVSDGDASWLSEGREIHGLRVEKEGRIFLERIFPHSNKEQSQIYSRNQILRRTTDKLGDQAFRQIGDEITDFALFDQDGNVVTRDTLLGRTTIINFVFTRCTVASMCPASTQRMARLLQLAKEKSLQNVLLLSLTLEPAYDCPGILKSYAMGFQVDDPQFRFLSGPLQPLNDLKTQLGVLSSTIGQDFISHTMRTILVGPDLKVAYQVPGSQWEAEDFFEKVLAFTQPPVPVGSISPISPSGGSTPKN